MSSLRSIIQKGRFYCDWEADHDLFQPLIHWVTDAFHSRQTIFVNTQSVWDDIAPPVAKRDEASWLRAITFADIPKPKPPFHTMWLETILKAEDETPLQRLGALIRRVEVNGDLDARLAESGLTDQLGERIREDQPATIVDATVFHDYEGSACVTCMCTYWLDADGNFLSSFRTPVPRTAKDKQEMNHYILRMRMRQGWIMHTFARMNCANARLVPVSNGHKNHRHHDQPPSSVWHVIQISTAPTIRRTGPAQPPDGECHVRFHWVRGHYADYSKGRGLFGNPKLCKVFWIPEHQAGDQELGEVVGSYTVQ